MNQFVIYRNPHGIDSGKDLTDPSSNGIVGRVKERFNSYIIVDSVIICAFKYGSTDIHDYRLAEERKVTDYRDLYDMPVSILRKKLQNPHFDLSQSDDNFVPHALLRLNEFYKCIEENMRLTQEKEQRAEKRLEDYKNHLRSLGRNELAKTMWETIQRHNQALTDLMDTEDIVELMADCYVDEEIKSPYNFQRLMMMFMRFARTNPDKMREARDSQWEYDHEPAIKQWHDIIKNSNYIRAV